MATIDTMSPPRSLSELEDVSDTTSSLGSGDWTDLSSAHPDDVSDSASVDGSEQPRPVIADIGGSEVWTTADALSSSSASVYASMHPESDGESDKSVRPFDPFREHDPLQLILPDPLERSDSTVAADLLSFSEDAVLATTPAAIVSLAGAHPSIAQRTAVVTDILVAIARATHSSVVRPDYYNFTTLSGLPTRVTNNNAPTNEISVQVRDHISDPLTNSVDNTPSILVIFTSDAQESTVPSVSGHSILIPVVLSESRPVVLFDERDAPDETSVDTEELVRQLSNLYTFERDSVATTQTAIEEPETPVHEPIKSVEPVKIVEPVQPADSDVRTTDIDDVQSLDAFDSDAKSLVDDTLRPDSDIDEKPRKPLARKRLPLDRIVGPERADAFRKFHANMGPGLTAACALAVFLSLVLGTNHLIQSSSKNTLPVLHVHPAHGMSTVPVEPSVTSTSLSTDLPHTSLALKSPHTSLALKSTHTSLATKSPHTSLAVKSQHTSVAVRSSTTTSLTVKSQHTNLSVHPESCYSVSASASTSLSATLASTSLSTTTPAPTATPDTKANILKEAAEEIGNAIERIERVIGLDLRRNTEAALKVIDSVRKSSAVCKASDKVEAVIEAVNRANEAIKAASGVDTAESLKSAKGEIHGRHQVARRTAQRQLASLKRGVENLVWGEKDVKGKGKAKDEPVNDKVKAKSKETPRPGREKWYTSKDHRFSSERITKKDKTPEKPKKTFPSRGEQEKAQTAGRGKRPTAKDTRHMDLDEEPRWMWDTEFAYELGYGPRAVVEEVREYFAF